jgi:flavin-binding protein dodecin
VASFLLVANQTLGGESLAAYLRRVIQSDAAAQFVVVVPMATAVPVDPGAVLGMGFVDAELIDHLEHDARERLKVLLEWFRDAGVRAAGRVVQGDPLAAMERVAQSHHLDEIVISTLPAGVSQWLRQDLVHRARRRFGIPITTIIGTASDRTFPSGAADNAPLDALESAGPSAVPTRDREGVAMSESVYKIIELVGTSTDSWEKAAAAAVATASRTLRDLRVAEIAQLDLVITDGAVSAYRAKLKVSFKYEDDE